MFTGIINNIGIVTSVSDNLLSIKTENKIFKIGLSIINVFFPINIASTVALKICEMSKDMSFVIYLFLDSESYI